MKEKTMKLYSIDELDEKAKQRAIDDWTNHGEFFADFVIEDCTERLHALGFEDVKIYYSGFYSQGDGACFVGTLDNDGLLKYLTAQKLDTKYKHITKAINDGVIYVNIKIKHEGRYTHEYSTNTYDYTEMQDNTAIADYDTELSREWYEFMAHFDCRVYGDTQQAYRVGCFVVDTNKQIYKDLQDEYEYQTSDASVIERLRDDGEVFMSNGERE